MSLVLTVPPAAEPLTLAEAKAHLRVDGGDDDVLIGALIAAARQTAEERLGRSLLSQTWRLTLPCFPASGGEIMLPRPPFFEIVSIVYVDNVGATVALQAADDYMVYKGSILSYVKPAYGGIWPTAREGDPAAVTIDYVAGYTDAAAVPAPIKAWMKIMIATLYDNRDMLARGASAQPMPRGACDGLLDPYIVPSIA